MDDITNNPPEDLRIAAMPLSKDERAFRRIYALATEAQLRVAEFFMMYPLSGFRLPVTQEEEFIRRQRLEDVLRRIKDVADSRI